MPTRKIGAESVSKVVEQPHKKELMRRINRIGGQVQGIARMIEDDRYCVDLLVQVSAVRAALNQVGMQIFEDHTRGCVSRAIRAGAEEETIAELMALIRKFTK